MGRRTAIGVVLALLALLAPARAGSAVGSEINVPAEQPTIQAGIDAATDGMTVVVAPGVYHEHIDFKGKALVVQSAGLRAAATVIDGDGNGPVVTFHSGEGRNAWLLSFTIRNGRAPAGVVGGGISVTGASPTISGNVITGNAASTGGAGIGVVSGAPLIQYNEISHNALDGTVSDGAGGGVSAAGPPPSGMGTFLEKNRIFDNQAAQGGGIAITGWYVGVKDNFITGNWATSSGGGAVLGVGASNSALVQNVITGNAAGAQGGGIAIFATGSGPGNVPTVVQNTVTQNTAPSGPALYVGVVHPSVLVKNNILIGPGGNPAVTCSSVPAWSHNDIYNGDPNPVDAACGPVLGVNGNISADPRFEGGLWGHDFRIKGPSPVIDATGLDYLFTVPDRDIEGRDRYDGDGDYSYRADIGAYEEEHFPRTPIAFGWNGLGQLGLGTTTSATVPTVVGAFDHAEALVGGLYHSLALLRDGTVSAWGWNGYGNLGDGTTQSRLAPVPVAGLSGIVAVAAGGYHSLALKSDGTVWAWGWNRLGQLGDGTITDHPTPVQVPGLTGVTAIAAGTLHSLAVKADGTVWAWGWNGQGELGDTTTLERHAPVQVAGLSHVSMITAGAYHSLAVSDRKLYAWGYNAVGQLGDGTTTNRTVPVVVPVVTDPAHIAAGVYHSLAAGYDQSLRSWGWNGYGQLGDGSTAERHSPVLVRDAGVIDVVAGAYHSLLADSDTIVEGFGWNGLGQLGDGTTTDRHVPTRIELPGSPNGLREFTIGAGAYHSLTG